MTLAIKSDVHDKYKTLINDPQQLLITSNGGKNIMHKLMVNGWQLDS